MYHSKERNFRQPQGDSKIHWISLSSKATTFCLLALAVWLMQMRELTEIPRIWAILKHRHFCTNRWDCRVGGTMFPRITECMRHQLSKCFLGVVIGDGHPKRANTWPLLTVLPSGAGCEFPFSLPLLRFSSTWGENNNRVKSIQLNFLNRETDSLYKKL